MFIHFILSNQRLLIPNILYYFQMGHQSSFSLFSKIINMFMCVQRTLNFQKLFLNTRNDQNALT